MKAVLLILLFLTTLPSIAQQRITLEECYSFIAKNYPLAKQAQLLDAQYALDTEVISNAKLPQLNLDAQATYQSDVIEIPIPNTTVEPLNKDQYRATLSVNQLIFNGGATAAALQLKSAQNRSKQKQLAVNLYQLKQKVNQLYFSILLSQATNALLAAKQKQLQAKLGEVQSGIKYGVILPASDKVLEAELLKLKQQTIAVQSTTASLIATLASSIGHPLDANTRFHQPEIISPLDRQINRPELKLFQFKKEEIESNEVLLAKQNSPKLLGFATGGYGNPGLNMLDNSFQSFYTVGLKLNWKVFDWNANKKQRQSLTITKDIVDTETEAFTLNTNIALDQQEQEIAKIESFITTDLAIINLRKEVLSSADSQLKNGVITASAYITELTNLYADENTLITHKIQLQLAKANYNVLHGL
ncbi:TolC family protein [Cellulophaga sp. F20128]|uniref:TolC family protein n=1 Tax=Cellulophaga sp. F20128 TaxID=2926413 RepID=UPI001FF4F034|nr:TolC family protein [Cellulophaga sp. F20128]MCK0156814.1 TolC family protein [Cellulophaga sp. F20128]